MTSHSRAANPQGDRKLLRWQRAHHAATMLHHNAVAAVAPDLSTPPATNAAPVLSLLIYAEVEGRGCAPSGVDTAAPITRTEQEG
ncbi:hypothetical protein [Amycolatopsis sp. NPDC050768]|uniref:hypothetical protein n=1 Tax=Amycolatopsis sp. NPDC050768 TaxID=3154839 RepID=UPI0033DBBA93